MASLGIPPPSPRSGSTPGDRGGFFGYLATARHFSPNARLFLGYALMSQTGSGIWMVVFNLYLLRSGFSTGFVGLFLMVDMLFHGLVAFPAGLIADRIGRRKAFFFATCLNLVARGSLLGGDALLEFNADQPGRLAIAIVSLENIQGDGPIALARFSVEGEKGTSSLELSQARAWEGESRFEALVNVEAGVLTIVGGVGLLLLIILIAAVAAVVLLISIALWRRGRRRGAAVSTG